MNIPNRNFLDSLYEEFFRIYPELDKPQIKKYYITIDIVIFADNSYSVEIFHKNKSKYYRLIYNSDDKEYITEII